MSNIFKSSEVLKHLNEEVKFANIRKKYDGERESTFLQKPNRPVPKGRNEQQQSQQQDHHESNCSIGRSTALILTDIIFINYQKSIKII